MHLAYDLFYPTALLGFITYRRVVARRRRYLVSCIYLYIFMNPKIIAILIDLHLRPFAFETVEVCFFALFGNCI